jgi:ribonuclease G
MTRQKVTDGPREVMTRKCPTCAGDGIVVSDATIALQIERRLKALAVAGAGSRVQAYRIALHPKELALLAGPGGERLRALEDATRRRFFLVPAEGHVHADHFEVLAEGRRDDLAPQTSLTEGAEVELKLVEIDLHDGTAAVGKLDGLDVVVADAAKLVGKKAKVTIGRVLEGQAFAALVGGEPGVAPITFESEAEKPTRAPSRRKADEADAAEPEAEETAEPEAEAAETLEAVADDEPEPEEAATDEDGEPKTPAKKRTRRGSRGGKRRKKAPATADDADSGGLPSEPAPAPATDDEAVDEAEDEAPPPVADRPPVEKPAPKRRAPRIHVPDDGAAPDESPEPETAAEETPSAEVDGDGAAPKKRTRRGSRGGRNRKKKATTAANGDGAEATELGEPDAAETVAVPLETNGDGAPTEPAPTMSAAEADDASTDSPDEAGYVPMSEWIEDFDRRA